MCIEARTHTTHRLPFAFFSSFFPQAQRVLCVLCSLRMASGSCDQLVPKAGQPLQSQTPPPTHTHSRPKLGHQRSQSASYASEVEGLTRLTLTDCRAGSARSRPVSWMNTALPHMHYVERDEEGMASTGHSMAVAPQENAEGHRRSSRPLDSLGSAHACSSPQPSSRSRPLFSSHMPSLSSSPPDVREEPLRRPSDGSCSPIESRGSSISSLHRFDDHAVDRQR